MRICNSRRAFTLVELLTVIAIIGILVSIAVPAAMKSFAAARAVQCSNNLDQLATATIGYAMDRNGFPGHCQQFGEFAGGMDPADPTNFGGAVPRHLKIGGWPIAIMSKLGNQPLYEVWAMDRYPVIADASASRVPSPEGYSAIASPNLAMFACPSASNQLAVRGINHYIANTGMHAMVPFTYTRPGASPTMVDFARTMSANNGLMANLYAGVDPNNSAQTVVKGKRVRLSDVEDGLSATMMLSENLQAMPIYMTSLSGNVNHLTSIQTVAGQDLVVYPGQSRYVQGMVWHFEDPTGFASAPLVNPLHRINGGDLDVDQMNTMNLTDLARPSSLHDGGAFAAMADGSVRLLSSDTDYRVYQALLTPRGKSSDVPMNEHISLEAY